MLHSLHFSTEEDPSDPSNLPVPKPEPAEPGSWKQNKSDKGDSVLQSGSSPPTGRISTDCS
jgi:hypothetical protein